MNTPLLEPVMAAPRRAKLPQVACAFAPASVGNVGVGFDLLGHSVAGAGDRAEVRRIDEPVVRIAPIHGCVTDLPTDPRANRSEEHTSELQSLMRISSAVFCLKKK